MKKFGLLSTILLFSINVWASSQPAAVIHYQKPEATVVIVDKSECSVNVYKFNRKWENIHKVGCDVGKVQGDKFKEGDLKTPIGFYQLTNAWTGETLRRQYGPSAKIYGAGAFELNYPNYLDKVMHQKTGYGIWLHGTDKAQPEATRGCIATSNEDFIELAQFIKLRQTPLIVEEKITYLDKSEIEKHRIAIFNFIADWKTSWESNDFQKYISFYDKNFKTPRFNYKQWVAHKKRVNQKNKNRRVQINDLSVFKVKDVYNVQFVQKYSSSEMNDLGLKYIYITEKEGKYQIISERWTKLPMEKSVSPLHVAYQQKVSTRF